MNYQSQLNISVLIPAYNEERNIYQVISVLKKSSYIDEIICINDGSTDQTFKILKAISKIRVINLQKNLGKANAIAQGLKKAKGEIVVFIDGDIKDLKEDTILELITPLKKGEAFAVIGYPVKSKMDKFFKPLSGARAYFRKDLLPNLVSLKDKRFGLELHLNYLFRHKKVKLVPLQIKNTMKHHKYSYNLAARTLFAQSFDILSEVIKQKNPLSYLKESYIYPFYRQRNLPLTED